MKRPATASRSWSKYLILGRIKQARLPADEAQFSWQELESAGLIDGFRVGADWNQKTKKLFCLLAVQARELRQECKRLKGELAGIKGYRSELWMAVGREPCPLQQAELRKRAEADQKRGEEAHRKAHPDMASQVLKLMQNLKPRPWEWRDSNSAEPNFTRSHWIRPMTLADYHQATGISRRTLHNLLRKLQARPISPRKKVKDPALYGVATNHQVLCHWLTSWVKDSHHRRGWLARTLVLCRHDAPEHFPALRCAAEPVISTLPPEQARNFDQYLEECSATLYPPRAELDLFTRAISFSDPASLKSLI